MPKKVVFIGGGTGLSHAVSGFKYNNEFELGVVVSVADDGGSSGEIIKHFNIVPPGDIRKACLALAQNEPLASALDYRFDEGNHIVKELGQEQFNCSTHHVGNLVFTAINEKNGNNILKTIETFSEMLHIAPNNKIYPSGINPVILRAKLNNDEVVTGQSKIQQSYNNKIVDITIESQLPSNPYVPAIIKNADLIVLTPGSLYTSTIVNLLFTNIKAELALCKAPVIYIANVMSQHGETDMLTLSDHINKIEHYMSRPLDLIVTPDTKIPAHIIEKYAQQNQHPLDVDNINQPTMIADILTFEDDLIFHDGDKIFQLIKDLLDD